MSYNASGAERALSAGSGEDASVDPSSSTFFSGDYKKNDDLKQMLDSSKDQLKLEAMKRIVGMVAKGKDASDLFPAVVKNVVSKNSEVKKLVFVYLMRYAEEQQDLALLSISTFQRALKDPNQLIRASALRVLSSIRVPIISPIMMIAIKDSVQDMSPYVRKTAANAIPKLYSLDPELKDELVQVIEKLLADKTTLVAGSVVTAFEEVCPDRIDLIHKNYRKLCNLLVDVDEWGQVMIISMLTRYARTQFADPNKDGTNGDGTAERPFYDDEAEHSDASEDKEESAAAKVYMMDPDHRLLLRNTKPLLQSRNAAVVMAVVQLYYHCAPSSELINVVRPMVRLLRSHREVQSVVLSNVATMAQKYKNYFEPHLKSFYVRSNDPTHVRLLKLEILTSLATESSISTILREFQTYVTSSDKEFAAATIQAIGRCATRISEVTDPCLTGLVNLMSKKDETVVGESVVVIKRLLQLEVINAPKNHADIIKHMAKLVNTIVVPMARASILWLIGEYSELVPKIAPDVLRNMAKTFVGEDDIVKLQILNLATKLMITNHKQTHVLAQYVFNLAKYDASYDIRDRARLLRAMIFPAEKGAGLAKYAKKVFLASKPAPMPESSYKDRDSLQLGSLSLMINQKASGYRELPPFPDAPPDPSVRNVVEPVTWTAGTKKKKPVKAGKAEKEKAFYSDDDESESTEGPDGSSAEEAEDSGAEEKDEDDEDEESTEEESSESDSDEEEEETEKSESSEEESESESDSSESDSSEASSDEEPQTKKTPTKAAPPAKATPPKATPPKETKPAPAKKEAKKEENLLDLLDFGGEDSGTSQVIPNAAAMLVPRTADARQAASESRPAAVAASSIFGLDSVVSGQHVVAEQEYEFLNRITGGGLVAAYRFPRTACLHSPRMVAVEVRLTNQGSEEVKAIKLTGSKLPSGVQLASFNEIALLAPNGSSMQTIGLNLNDSTQPVNLEVCTAERQFAVTLKAPVGELVAPKPLQETAFNEAQAKLRGMNETSSAATLRNPLQGQEFAKAVVRIVNLIQVPSSESQTFKFSGQTVSGQSAVLVACKVNANQVQLTVNCDKLVIGSMLAKELKEALERL